MREIDIYVKPSQEKIDPMCLQSLIEIMNDNPTQKDVEEILNEYEVIFEI